MSEQKQIPFVSRLWAAVEGGRRVFALVTENQMPYVVASSVQLAEAQSMQDIAREDIGWEGGGGPLDDRPWNHQQMQATAFRMGRDSLLANRLLEILVDFQLGDGATVVAKHEDDLTREQIQDECDALWKDPINDMENENPGRLYEQLLWGELCMPVQRNEGNGRIRLGWITPGAIRDVRPHPLTGKPGVVVLSQSAAAAVGMKELRVIAHNPMTGLMEGDCFFRPLNVLKGQHRGQSELYRKADWIDIMSNTLKTHADRARHDAMFMWDVLLKGKTDEEILAWQKIHAQRPKPNSVRVHNENAEWKAVSPNLGSADMGGHINTLRTFILGGSGIPNHWVGDGGDANLATAAVMSEPTKKMLKRKQKATRALFADIVRFHLLSVQMAGGLPGVDLSTDPFDVQIPDFSGPDIAKVGAALVQVVGAVTQAEEGEYLSKATGREIIGMVMSETGIEIDPAQEAEKIEAEAQDRADKAAEEDNAREDQMAKDLRDAAGEGPTVVPQLRAVGEE